MSKAKKKRLKKAGKPNQKPVSSVQVTQPEKVYPLLSPLITYLGLIAIVIFSMFLRAENFSVWQKNKAAFQYQDEYQMANFDSYYYLKAAKDLQNGTYDSSDELRRVPNSMERPAIPPLLSTLAMGISSITGISLASIAIFLPVILSALLPILVFFIGVRFQLTKIASLTAAFFSAISLTYVARTRIGVFDTDSLNVIFPLINSYLLYSFVQAKNKQVLKYLGLSLLTTLLYLTWWNTASSIVIISFIAPLSVVAVFFYPSPKPLLKYGILGLVLLTSLFFVKDQVFALFKLVSGSSTSLFPNNMDISELDSVSIDDFVKKSLNNLLLVIISFLGLAYFIFKQRLKALIFAVPILLTFSPFAAGNRFILFAAPIMAIGIGYAIELLSQYTKKIHPIITTMVAVFMMVLGIQGTYKMITDKHQPTAAYENTDLLTAIKNNTPAQSDIWTDADLGYQVQYYLDRGTFADGEFEDGEIRYYLCFPLAADNLALAANYMQFYHRHGLIGMKKLYSLFPNVNETFSFLKQVLSLKPAAAQLWLAEQQQAGKLPATEQLKTIDQWLSFLYPKTEKELYLFTYYKMTQTASWFKQGNADLVTGETKGLPLFLALNGLQMQNNLVGNNQIRLDTLTGRADYVNGQKHSFQYLLTYDGTQAHKLAYNKSGKLISENQIDKNDKRFALQWNKRLGFGAAVSKEMGNTALVKLYLQNQASEYFEPVALQTPMFQIWKVQGDHYESQ